MFRDLSFNEFNGTLPLLPDSIESLDLSHNRLDDLPASLPAQLRRLDLSHNEFKLIHLPSVSPRIDPQQCILYGDSDENCFLNVTNNECGSCFGAFGCSRREVFNPGCVPTTTTLATTTTTSTTTTIDSKRFSSTSTEIELKTTSSEIITPKSNIIESTTTISSSTNPSTLITTSDSISTKTSKEPNAIVVSFINYITNFNHVFAKIIE